jgi:uroporphyrin-III C-methyltransferase
VNGKVYLVGAGPGDPELLTLKALNILRRADAVLHDDLVSAEILAHAPKQARRYNVGKRSGQKSTPQEAIHFLMIELARQGMEVVRLKGGDPTVFGRAGEEIRALRAAGIEFEIVPGVTSALAAAAKAEIALTQRETASFLLIMTGHFAQRSQLSHSHPSHDSSAPVESRPLPDLRALLSAGATIAVYMPGPDPRILVERLAAAGVPRSTPCAVVACVTTPAQEISITTLSELQSSSLAAKPAVLIIGNMANFARQRESIQSSILSHPEFAPAFTTVSQPSHRPDGDGELEHE